mgnify:CR=1 FL=1
MTEKTVVKKRGAVWVAAEKAAWEKYEAVRKVAWRECEAEERETGEEKTK